MESNDQNQESRKQWSAYARYGSSAFQMIAVLLLGVWGGRRLDAYIGFRFPLFLLLFTLGGLGLSMYSLIRKAMNEK